WAPGFTTSDDHALVLIDPQIPASANAYSLTVGESSGWYRNFFFDITPGVVEGSPVAVKIIVGRQDEQNYFYARVVTYRYWTEFTVDFWIDDWHLIHLVVLHQVSDGEDTVLNVGEFLDGPSGSGLISTRFTVGFTEQISLLDNPTN